MTQMNGLEDDHANFSFYQRAFKKSQKASGSSELSNGLLQTNIDEVHESNTNPNHELNHALKPTVNNSIPNSNGPKQSNLSEPNTRIANGHENTSKFQVGVMDENDPPYHHAEDIPIPSSFPNSKKKATSQSNLDEWSKAELNFQKNKHQRSAPSWLSKREDDGSESDSSREAKQTYDPDDEAYDSDLVTEPDEENRVARVHAKNLRKWKAQASGHFENMLIECIVNTGRKPTHFDA